MTNLVTEESQTVASYDPLGQQKYNYCIEFGLQRGTGRALYQVEIESSAVGRDLMDIARYELSDTIGDQLFDGRRIFYLGEEIDANRITLIGGERVVLNTGLRVRFLDLIVSCRIVRQMRAELKATAGAA